MANILAVTPTTFTAPINTISNFDILIYFRPFLHIFECFRMRLGNIGNSKKYDFLTWHSPAILSHYIVSFCPFPFYCRSRYLWIPQRAKICSEAFMRQRQLFRPLLSWICCKQVSRWFWYFLILFWLLTAMQCHSQTVRCTPWSCSGDHEWRHVWHQLVKLLQYCIT